MGQLVDDVTKIITGNKDERNAKREYENERQKILAQIESDEKAKANLVKKILATQRAGMGASGMSGKSLSDEAVLKRLREETEQPFSDKKRINIEKISKLKKPQKTNLIKFFLDKIPDMG